MGLDSGLRRSDGGGDHIIANNRALRIRRNSNHCRPGVGRDPGKDVAPQARLGLDSGLRRSDGGGDHIIARTVRFDSAKLKSLVVPAKAGIQAKTRRAMRAWAWTPAFAGATNVGITSSRKIVRFDSAKLKCLVVPA